MPLRAEGEQVAESFPKLWRLENRFTQMQIEISLIWYFLLLSAARSRDGWSKNPHHLELHLLYCLDNSCLKQTTSANPHLPFHPLLFYFQKSHKEHRSYSSFHKAAEGWKQLPKTFRCNSFNHHSARTQTNWEASLPCPRLTFLLAFYFPAICTSQSHEFVQSLAVKLITFLGGNCKGGVHIGRPIQRHKCPREDTPTQHIPGILLFPALPDICLLYQDAESGHRSASPSFSAQRSVGVSRRKQGVQPQLTMNIQHCCCLTHISEQ